MACVAPGPRGHCTTAVGDHHPLPTLPAALKTAKQGAAGAEVTKQCLDALAKLRVQPGDSIDGGVGARQVGVPVTEASEGAWAAAALGRWGATTPYPGLPPAC